MSTRRDFLFLGVSMVPETNVGRSWLHENGPVQLVLALAKLNVTPLKPSQFSLAQSVRDATDFTGKLWNGLRILFICNLSTGECEPEFALESDEENSSSDREKFSCCQIDSSTAITT